MTRVMDDPFPEGIVEETGLVLAELSRQPDGQDTYDCVFRSGLVFPLQRKRELAKVMQLCRALPGPDGAGPRVVMEIGADKGGGLMHWLKSLPTVERLIACELRGLPYRDEFQAAFPDKKFLWLHGPSDDPGFMPAAQDFLEGQFIDVLFIDGDKDSMYDDYALYRDLVRQHGGLILVHDVCDPAPGRCWERIVRETPLQKSYVIAERDEWREVDPSREELTSHDRWLLHWRGRSCTVGVVET